MGTGRDPRLREALQLARAGEKEQARQILIELLRQNRNNFDAWVIIAQVAENDQEAMTCIKQALRLHPDDEGAKRYLEYLLQSGKNDTTRNDTPKGRRISPWLWGGLGAALIALVLVAALFVAPRMGWQTQGTGGAFIAENTSVPAGSNVAAISTGTPTTEPTAGAMPTATQEGSTPTATTQPPTATTPPPTASNTPTDTPTATATATMPPPTATTAAPSTATTGDSTDPCAAFTFGGIKVDPANKAISITVSHPSGATLTDILVAWSMDGSLDQIKHGAALIPDTGTLIPPAIISVSEAIGANDSLEFWFSDDPVPTGYTIVLGFDGGCTKSILN